MFIEGQKDAAERQASEHRFRLRMSGVRASSHHGPEAANPLTCGDPALLTRAPLPADSILTRGLLNREAGRMCRPTARSAMTTPVRHVVLPGKQVGMPAIVCAGDRARRQTRGVHQLAGLATTSWLAALQIDSLGGGRRLGWCLLPLPHPCASGSNGDGEPKRDVGDTTRKLTMRR
jgi:hypothetical protein